MAHFRLKGRIARPECGLGHCGIPAVIVGDAERESVGYIFVIVDLNISAVSIAPDANFPVIDNLLWLKQLQDSENFALLDWR